MNAQEREKKAKNFRAYDIRGVYQQDIDPILFFEVGVSLVYFLKEKKLKSVPIIYVGYDIRTTSSLLAHAFIAGVLAAGAKVNFSGTAFPFGVIVFSGSKTSDCSAFITASHLPSEYNGIKFYYADGVGFSEEDNITIRDIYLSEKFRTLINDQTWKSITTTTTMHKYFEYKDFFSSRLALPHPLNVVIDCGNGSVCINAEEVFQQCGYIPSMLFNEVDPTFPNRSPEPDEKSLTQLIKQVISSKADYGVGFDADGDRAVLVDDLGRVLAPEHIGLIIITNYEKISSIKKEPVVIANVECSSVLEKFLKDKAKIYRVKVGHTYLTLEAREKQAIIGLESSGHFVFPEFFLFDDAMVTPLLIGKILEKTKKTLSTLVNEIPVLHKSKKVVDVSDERKFQVIEKLVSKLSLEYSNIDTIDGIGITMDDGWALIRASNTSPAIRITTESSSKIKADQLLDKFEHTLVETINSLK